MGVCYSYTLYQWFRLSTAERANDVAMTENPSLNHISFGFNNASNKKFMVFLPIQMLQPRQNPSRLLPPTFPQFLPSAKCLLFVKLFNRQLKLLTKNQLTLYFANLSNFHSSLMTKTKLMFPISQP